ncbi:hypothetical protein N7510_005603 [Penicillium lagena]|uniref:uncharacterized protein n=1 Tax=Penicillium lagena TaxID=94218 RepID=UPI0025422840|nr:uncharacterized protein N7510_005603 [Penicillium lagena]KAJ5612409.1 hypothetical protein N7510_005603 [Penicillium lagena]
MRWSSRILALAVTGALGASAFDASLFTFHLQDGQEAVSEDVAHLILELRTKSSLAAVLGKMETETADQLNQFVQSDGTLFGGADDHDAPKRSLVLLEGIDGQVGSAIQKSQPSYIRVPHASSDFMNSDALESFLGSDGTAINGKHCTYHSTAGLPMTSENAKKCVSEDPILSSGGDLLGHDFLRLIDSVETWTPNGPGLSASRILLKSQSSSGDSERVANSLESFFHTLTKLSSSGKQEITALILPRRNDSEHKLARRGISNMLSRAPNPIQPRAVRRSAQDLSVPSTLTPVCHASNSSCVEATNNCSGHGHCYKKSGSGNSGAGDSCYACRCTETVVKKDDGTTETIQWGGSACQKRDISSPFFLIAGVSILVVAMVSSAIGMLFSVGQQELPSVIGAGVGGTKAPM